ncbi:MAG: GAF and HD-GYP domain-containing protein [Planctomycetota bacterium]
MNTKKDIYKESLKFLRRLLLYSKIEDVIDDSVKIATKLLNAQRATLFIYDYNRNILYSKIGTGLKNQTIELTLDRGIAGWVAKNKKLVNIKNVYKDERFLTSTDKKLHFKTKNMLCVPLLSIKNEILGVLQILNKKKGHFLKREEKIAQVLGETLSSILENFNLHQENERMLKSTIKALSSAIDARDPVTKGHSERVSKLAVAIGRELGYSEQRLRLLEYAALLHDIGKLGIRDNILLKPGILTYEEFAVMKSHAEITRSILEQIYFPPHLNNIPYIASSHHEKLDGSGYPKGLKSNQIPEEAKIIAVCDIFDALISHDRPYKKAMSIDQARTILEQQKGIFLDPKIVSLLFNKELYKEVLENPAQQKETTA